MAYTPFEKSNARGFTLVELAAVMMIAMLIAFIIFRLSNSIQGREKLSGTRGRMEMISTKIKQYYRAHEQLPAAAGPNLDQLPVQPDALNMEQKYRLDEWGTFYVYDPGDVNNIQDVDGYAATITSAGPDQLVDPPNDRDNLVINFDLTQEANDIVLNKLKVLQEKVAAYDAMFPSVDNDADGAIDENPRDAAAINVGAVSICPPTGNFANDPSEGLSTLDAIEEAGAYGCAAPLVNHIVEFYGLKSDFPGDCGTPGDYRCDPWRDPANPGNPTNPFAWGYEGRGSITRLDRRYHRFYSLGPDGIDDTGDEITYSAK